MPEPLPFCFPCCQQDSWGLFPACKTPITLLPLMDAEGMGMAEEEWKDQEGGDGEEGKERRRGRGEKIESFSVCSGPEPKSHTTNCFFLHTHPRERSN